MNKHVLYVSYDGMTDPLGQSQVIPYMCGLSRLGYRITILSCEKKDRFRKMYPAIKEQLDKAGIRWEYLHFSTRPPLLSKFWDIKRLKAKAARLHRQNNFSIVHCRSYMASMVGLHLKTKSGIPFIFDMRGFWADERVDGAVWNKTNPVYKRLYGYFKGLEQKCLLAADATICLTRKGIEEMRTWSYVNAEVAAKIHHITTCCDIRSYAGAFSSRAQRRLDEQRVRFVYIGSIGPWHSYDRLTAFIKAAYLHLPGSFFKLIVNTGREAMEKFIADNGFERDRFEIKFVPHSQVPAELGDTDIAFFFIPQQYSKIASSPTKMGEMLSAGLPVITGAAIGDVDELVLTNDIGSILTQFDEKSIAASLDQVLALCKNDQPGVMNRCLATAESYFSLEKGIDKYRKIYESLTR